MQMQVESTSVPLSKGNNLWAAAVAASCLAAPVQAHTTAVRLFSGEMPHILAGSSSDWTTESAVPQGIIAGLGQLQLNATRATSEQEHLIARLREWERYPANWDGEGALSPKLASLLAASSFACALDRDDVMPQPMLNDNGRAGLFWDDGGLYAELEFLENGKVAYYIERVIDGRAPDRHKGVVSFNGREIPPVLRPLLGAVSEA